MSSSEPSGPPSQEISVWRWDSPRSSRELLRPARPAAPGDSRGAVDLAAQQPVTLAARLDAVPAHPPDRGPLVGEPLRVLRPAVVGRQLRLLRLPGKVDAADVDLVVDLRRRG